MMETQVPTIDEAVEAELCDCVNCLTVPLSILALEVDVPIGGWDGMLDSLEIKQVVDHIGRKAVSAAGARRLLSTVRRRHQLAAEDHDRRSKELARRHSITPGGVPMVEGASPLESLAAAPNYQLPSDEFQGIPRHNFLAEELAAGQRADEEKKAMAAARKAERLAAEMKDKLR